MEKIKRVNTVCGLCHTNCGMIVEVEGNSIKKIRGNPHHPANRGALCRKGIALKEIVHSPDRLRYPLKKTKGGFSRITWEEAIDTVAQKLWEIKERWGAECVLRFAGAPVTEATRDAFAQLLAAYGSPNFTSPGHLCSQPRRLALDLVYGGRTDPDYRHTKCILLWGANPTASMRPAERFVYGRFDRVITEARERGAKLLCVDPYRIPLAKKADLYVPIKLGTDAALALGMIHVIIREGLYDRPFVENWTIGFSELVEYTKKTTPQWAAAITGVDAATIEQLAEIYATTKPALIREGNGFDQHTNVVDSVRLIAILTAITGNLDVPGGNIFFSMPKLGPCPSIPVEKKCIGAQPYPLFARSFPPMLDAILSGEPYQPRVLIVYHSNPLLINAWEDRVRKAFDKLEFLIVSDVFMTATAQMADIILPDTTPMERFGFQPYAGYDGGIIAFREKAIEPIGEAQPVFDVEYAIAEKLGLAPLYPWRNTEEWIDYKVRPSGLSFSALMENPIHYVGPPLIYEKYKERGFATPSGKVELSSPRLASLGLNPLPIYREAEVLPEEKYPLQGTTCREAVYVHTQFRNIPSLRAKAPEPLLRIHPRDAYPRDIETGVYVTVSSPQGTIRLKAMVTKDTQPGLVVIDFGWGNPGDGGPNVNILTSDRERDPFTGATPNRRFICEVQKET